MTAWDDTLAAALLGTARRPPPEPSVGGRLGAVLGATATDRAPEGALLATAGALAVYLRAGERPPPPTGDPVEPAEPDPRPLPPPAFAAYLPATLRGGAGELLDEWLRLTAERGWRAPPEALPDLLTRIETSEAGSQDVLAVTGSRGRWLAAQAPEWELGGARARTPEEAEQAFRTGAPEERRAALADLRAADPGRVRALVAETWSSEAPDAREALLGVLETELSPDDEPLLERALRDRRRATREQASWLLSSLPDSAHARRVAAVAGPCLELTGGLRRTIAVRPPDDLDPDLGLHRKPPKGTGERAFWLQQLLDAAPLRTWTDRFGLAPEAIAATRVERGWAHEVWSGWATAAHRERDAAWARALLDHRPRGTPPDPLLLDLLPVREREERLAALLDGNEEVALPDGPWGRALSEAAVGRLGDLGGSLPAVVAALDPATLGDAERGLERLASQAAWATRDAARALGLLHVRRGMLAALTEEPE